MKENRASGRLQKLLSTLVFVFSVSAPAFAQQLAAAPREQLMTATLRQLQEGQKAVHGSREDAIKEAMEEVQLDALQVKPEKQRVKASSMGAMVVQAHPYISQGTSYWDKMDPKNDKHHVVVFNQAPGLLVNLLGKNKFMNFDFSVNDARDPDRSTNRSDSARVNLTSNFVLNNFNFSVTDQYFNNYLAGPDIGIDPKFFNYLWQNDFGATLSSRFNRLGLSLGYQRTDVNYRNITGTVPDANADTAGQVNLPGGTSYYTDVYSLSSNLKLAPKTSMGFNYSYGRSHYLEKVDVDGDNYYNLYDTSLSGVLTPKITGTLGTDYKITHFRSNSGDTKDLGFGSGISYAFSERTNLGANYKYTHHFEKGAINYYHEVSYGITGNHRLAFNPKLLLSFTSGWDITYNDKVAGPTEIKKNRTFGLGLNYAFRQWLDFGLSYSYKRYDYNYNDDEYGKHSVQLSTNARF